MKQSKIKMVLMNLKKYIRREDILLLSCKLENSDDGVFEKIATLKLINPMVILYFSIFLGLLGVDRIMIKDYYLGIVKLLITISGIVFINSNPAFSIIALCGAVIWTLIDMFLCYIEAKEINLEKIQEVL